MLNSSVFAIQSELLPLTSMCAVLNGSKFERVVTLWHVAFNPGRWYRQLFAHVKKKTFVITKTGVYYKSSN